MSASGSAGPATAWSLVQYDVVPGGQQHRVGLLLDGVVHVPPAALTGSTMLEVLADWERNQQVLRRLDDAAVRDSEKVEGARLAVPLTYPRKVLCAGTNYYDHCEEMGTARPDPRADPFFFLKAPTTTVVGPDAVVTLPQRAHVRFDWEAELGVVIGSRCKDVPPDRARQHVAGYLVADDLSDRGAFPRTNPVLAPFAFDWLAHKSVDGSCPIGPGLVPAWLVADPQALAITLSVNGVVKQDSNTAQMVIGIDDLVAGASRLMTLEPGDLVLTGTPAGVGAPKGTFLHDGDVVTVTIERLGSITHTIEE